MRGASKVRTPRLEQEVVRTLQVSGRRMERELKVKEEQRREATTLLQRGMETATLAPSPQGATLTG